MPGISLPTLAAYAAGLAATLVLAAFLTPRSWWKRANARALAVLAAGTFAIGGLLSWLLVAGKPAVAAPQLAAALPASLNAGVPYRVRDHLNLRASRNVGAPRLGVVPAGAVVTATGNQSGDWWEISAQVDGRTVRGWASSLWLRRVDERRH
jgi:uncharacterized membrane protein YfcA